MNKTIARHPFVIVVSALIVGALIGVLVAMVRSGSASDSADPSGGGAETTAPSPDASVTPDASAGSASAPPTAGTIDCTVPSTAVTTADELTAALRAATPGAVITMAPGTYVGNFVATTSGSAEAPITLCGTPDSVLDGDDVENGYGFHLDGGQYWQLSGFTVTNSQKGVMADTTVGSVIDGLTVTHIGDEAVHLRKASTDNRVLGNTISDTGVRKPKFGEGIYIGTAESNWCDISDCEPDKSDRNEIAGNTISGTSAESVDLKEGSSDGILRGNTFDGSAITEADSWVDVKGNGYLIEGNTGTNSPLDGFQTHEILDGWGTDNTFQNNVANLNAAGFGYSLTPERGNVVSCTNTAANAGEGVTNVDCVT